MTGKPRRIYNFISKVQRWEGEDETENRRGKKTTLVSVTGNKKQTQVHYKIAEM